MLVELSCNAFLAGLLSAEHLTQDLVVNRPTGEPISSAGFYALRRAATLKTGWDATLCQA